MGKPRGGKAAVKDFEKKKQKLGKKKLAPTNSTSTQFKARSVVLPDQTIGAERGEPVSHRQLTLGELVGQLKHYSADVRHDAVRGLLELVTRHPEVLAPRAAELLDAALPALTDGDRAVRAATLALLRAATCPRSAARRRSRRTLSRCASTFRRRSRTRSRRCARTRCRSSASSSRRIPPPAPAAARSSSPSVRAPR